MKKSRYSEEQIIAVLKEHQVGIPVAELCRKHGISDATFYNWRSRYGGMDVSDARRLKGLEEENRKWRSRCWTLPRSVRRSEKTSEARIAESVRELGHGREALLAAASLRANRAGPEDLPLRFAPHR